MKRILFLLFLITICAYIFPMPDDTRALLRASQDPPYNVDDFLPLPATTPMPEEPKDLIDGCIKWGARFFGVTGALGTTAFSAGMVEDFLRCGMGNGIKNGCVFEPFETTGPYFITFYAGLTTVSIAAIQRKRIARIIRCCMRNRQ